MSTFLIYLGVAIFGMLLPFIVASLYINIGDRIDEWEAERFRKEVKRRSESHNSSNNR